jgi:hypothetical protein
MYPRGQSSTQEPGDEVKNNSGEVGWIEVTHSRQREGSSGRSHFEQVESQRIHSYKREEAK